MSAGIRSGVNCTRFCARPSTDAQGLGQLGLGEAGDADQQGVAAGQQGDQGVLDHPLLAEDDAADRFPHAVQAFAERFDLRHQGRGVAAEA